MTTETKTNRWCDVRATMALSHQLVVTPQSEPTGAVNMPSIHDFVVGARWNGDLEVPVEVYSVRVAQPLQITMVGMNGETPRTLVVIDTDTNIIDCFGAHDLWACESVIEALQLAWRETHGEA